jgi:Na+-transporting methylmalonyl-CoA/oxaloacetate decarboxylase gamma subunit
MNFLILLVVMMALFSSVALAANKKNAGSKYSKNKKGKPHQGA